MTILLIFWFLMDILIFGLMLYMPVMRKEEAFFGTRVSLETYQSVGKQILNHYRLWLTLTFLQVEALGLILSYYRGTIPLARLVSLPLMIIAGMVFYVIFARQVKPYHLIEEDQRFATSLKIRHISDYTNLGLEIVIGLFILAPTMVLIYYYPLLPDRIPVHWNFAGQPDRWSNKNIFSVFLLPVTTVYLQGLFWLIKYGMMQVKMTLPVKHTTEYFEIKEQLLAKSIQLLDKIRLLQVILMGAISLNVLSAMFGNGDMTKWIVVMAVVADLVILVLVGLSISEMMGLDEKLKSIVGQTYVESEKDSQHWYGGGMFYYNPGDPALFIEKKVGYGYTMNCANKQLLLYIGYGVSLPILMLVLAMLGKI